MKLDATISWGKLSVFTERMNVWKMLICLRTPLFFSQTCKDGNSFTIAKRTIHAECLTHIHQKEEKICKQYTKHYTKRNEEHSKLSHMYSTIMYEHKPHKQADIGYIRSTRMKIPHNLSTPSQVDNQ